GNRSVLSCCSRSIQPVAVAMSTSSSPLARLAITLVLLSAGGVATAYTLGWIGGGKDVVIETPSPAPAEPDTAPVGPAPAPAAVEVPLQTPAEAGIPEEDCILYPDGTRLPPLNGVEKAPRVAFHRRIPFTRVVGRHRGADGVEWYVHENGAMSTTRFQVRNGVREAVGEVTMPVTPSTVLEDK
ncbi:MAG: hypothetical protein KDC98_16750, partial [Planctomycetes bacterium]|nr:hypothetical protein [Planctomycetota bacterium]